MFLAHGFSCVVLHPVFALCCSCIGYSIDEGVSLLPFVVSSNEKDPQRPNLADHCNRIAWTPRLVPLIIVRSPAFSLVCWTQQNRTPRARREPWQSPPSQVYSWPRSFRKMSGYSSGVDATLQSSAMRSIISVSAMKSTARSHMTHSLQCRTPSLRSLRPPEVRVLNETHSTSNNAASTHNQETVNRKRNATFTQPPSFCKRDADAQAHDEDRRTLHATAHQACLRHQSCFAPR